MKTSLFARDHDLNCELVRMPEPTISVRVMQMHFESAGVISLLLQRVDGGPLPAFEAGAHVDVHLPNGICRSYSLSDLSPDGRSYRITIARDARSRGGSSFIHDNLRAGDVLQITPPRNNFPLDESSSYSLFIAGGIGITPFISMIRRLNERGGQWKLHYCVRTRDRAALLDEVNGLASGGTGEVTANFDEEPGARQLDITSALRALPANAHVYCCGPIGMLDAYRAAAEALGLAPDRVHFEYFSSDVETASDGGFTVVCERSGKSVLVSPGQTILDAVTSIGIDAPSSCLEGICGSCETRIISGLPDHRDMILSSVERASGKSMMICCSGSKSDTIVLDL